MIKSASSFFALALGVALLILVRTFSLRVSPRHSDAGLFTDVRSITFIQDLSGRIVMPGVSGREGPMDLKLAVTNLADVQGFRFTIHLEKKELCRCLHMHCAIFETPEKEIEVSFCAHCFDIAYRGGVRDYKMPEAFYNELLKQIRARGQAGWLLPELSQADAPNERH